MIKQDENDKKKTSGKKLSETCFENGSHLKCLDRNRHYRS